MDKLDYIIRYNNARYMFLESVKTQGRESLSMRVQTEFIQAADELHSRGIVYVEMGSPKRAPFYSL